jgi:hypothetical protein
MKTNVESFTEISVLVKMGQEYRTLHKKASMHFYDCLERNSQEGKVRQQKVVERNRTNFLAVTATQSLQIIIQRSE